MLDFESRQIFLKYKNALIAIGVDLSNEFVIDYIEGCGFDLETRFQSIIAYWYWLQSRHQELIDPNALLIQAFHQQWQPINWQEEYLNHVDFQSPAQQWWLQARHIDILNSLVVDVQDNFWSGGKIFFLDSHGERWTLDLDRAKDMTWQQFLAHYQRVTGIVIESHPGRFILHPPSSP